MADHWLGEVRRRARRFALSLALALLCALLGAGCGGDTSGAEETEGEAAESVGSTAEALTLNSTLNTFVLKWLEIDQQSTGGLSPADANLFVGADPADGTASYPKPPKAAGDPNGFIDWNDLGLAPFDPANHRLLDLNDASGKDPTAFPQANECVGKAQVLSKMDLTYVAAAHNNTYAYFAVQRSNNSGDAGYYWLFTKLAPKLQQGQAPCKADQSRLLYDVSPNDVLLVGHFHPNGSPLLRVFLATGSQSNVPAVSAVDFTSSLWSENASGVTAVAVNTTITSPGSLGSAGVLGLSGSNLGTELITEAAVPLSIFSGIGQGGSACGAEFYGSVITRSSGSGGTSPDLKDLAGPAKYNLKTITAEPSLTPSCGQQIGFQVDVLGYGANDPALTCHWEFYKDGGAGPVATADGCNGNVAVGAPGSYTGKVTVTANTGCVSAASTSPVTVYPPLTVTPNLTSHCAPSFTYDATVSGGSNPAQGSFAWTFAGNGGTPTPASSSAKSGTVSVDQLDVTYDATVVYTDPRTDVTCTAMGATSIVPTQDGCYGLTLIKGVDKASAAPGDLLTYTLSYSNSGESPLTNVMLSDPLPAKTTFVSLASAPAIACSTPPVGAAGTVSCSIPTLAPGASGTLTLTVKLDGVFPAGTTNVTNVAVISSKQTPPQNAQASTIVSAAPSLAITKAVDKATASPGDQLVYTLSYANLGNADASGVIVSDTLPPKTTFVSATGGGTFAGGAVTWNLGAVPAGGSGVVSFTVQLDAVFPSGTTLVTNVAVISSTSGGAPSNEVVTAVSAVAALSMTLDAVVDTTTANFSDTASVTTAEGASANAGTVSNGVPKHSNILYTLTLTNAGNADVSSVVISDPLPAGAVFVGASNGGAYDGPSNTVTWTIASLAAGASIQRTLTVSIGPP